MHAADSTILAEAARSAKSGAPARVVRWWRRPAVLATLLALMTLVVYARLYRAELLDLDDHENITFNEFLNPPSWSGLSVFWLGAYRGMYAPVAYTFLAGESWMAQYLPGTEGRMLDASIFHAGNVVLLAISVVLVFLSLRWLVGDDVGAALGALFFALHPMQVESVAWVTEFRGMVCAVFAMLSIYAYLRYLGSPPRSMSADGHNSGGQDFTGGRTRLYGVACAAYGLALLSKPSAVSIPLMLFVVEVGFYGGSMWRAMGRLAWWGVPAVLLALWTRELQDANVSRFVFEPAWWQRPLIACDAISFYLWKLVVPVGLAFDHGRNPQTVLAHGWIYVVWLVPLGIVALLALLPGRRVWLTVAGIFAAGILPSSGLISFTFQDLSTVAERYAFFAMLGPALAFAWMMSRPPLLRWRGEISLLLVILGLLTVRQTGFWHDTQTLLAHGLEVNPDSTLCLTAQAMQQANAGDLVAAETLLLRVVAINPREPNVWKNLAVVYSRSDRPEEAILALERAIEQHGNDAGPKMDLAKVYIQQRDYRQAIALLREILQSNSSNHEAHAYLASALVNLGQHAEAVVHWRAVIQAEPTNADARQMLAESLAPLGQYSAALVELEAVLRLRPGDQRALEYIALIEKQTQAEPRTIP